jgi:ubiquinone biosynthesis protein
MLARYTPRRVATRARKEARALVQVLREAPYQWHETMELMRRGQFEVGFVHKGLGEFTTRMEHAFNRLVVALVVAGGLVGSSLIGIFAKSGPHVLGLHFISLLGFLLSGVLGVWLLVGVIRSGRL